ncbi:MAG: hypothetical protein GY941_20740, partial [Planctomycetes bacterium]|nr:hypothetical protein [Planctomycetota bacterium]
MPKLDWIVNVSATGASKVKKAREEFEKLDRSAKRTSESFRAMKKSSIVSGIGITSAGAAAYAVVNKFNRLTGEIDLLAKSARRLDFPIEEYQEWGFVAEQSGVNQGVFNSSLKAFTKRLGEAKNGTGALTTFLNKSNPALLEQLKTTDNVNDSLGIFIDELRNAKTAQDRAALASAGFSRAGMDMINITHSTTDAVQALKDEMRANGLVTDEQAASAEAYEDAVNSMGKSFDSLARNVLIPLAPILTSIMDTLNGIALHEKFKSAIGGQNSLLDLASREGELLMKKESAIKRIAELENTINKSSGFRNVNLNQVNEALEKQREILRESTSGLVEIENIEKRANATKIKIAQDEEARQLRSEQLEKDRLNRIDAAKRLSSERDSTRLKVKADNEKARELELDNARLERIAGFNEEKRAIEQSQFMLRSQDYSLETMQREEALVNAQTMERENLKAWYEEKKQLSIKDSEERLALDDLYATEKLVLETNQNHAMRALNDEQIANERRLFEEKAGLAQAGLSAARTLSGDNKVLALADIAFSGYMAQVRAMQLLPNIPLAATASIMAAT